MLCQLTLTSYRRIEYGSVRVAMILRRLPQVVHSLTANAALSREVWDWHTGRLVRPGFGRCRGPVAVGILVPRCAAHPRDDRPFSRGQVGMVVEEEPLQPGRF